MDRLAIVLFEDSLLRKQSTAHFNVYVVPEDREELRQRIATAFACDIWGVFMPSLGHLQETIKVRFDDEENFTPVTVANPMYAIAVQNVDDSDVVEFICNRCGYRWDSSLTYRSHTCPECREGNGVHHSQISGQEGSVRGQG